MATATQSRFAEVLTEEATSIRNGWGWLLALGIVQIIVGVLAVSYAFSATVATVVTLGVLFLIAACAQLTAAFLTRGWRGFFLFLLLGILYAIAGFLMISQPMTAAEGLTLMLAVCFLLGGTFRIITALIERFPYWGWVLFNGAITVVLSIAIWQQWPSSGLWVLGLFVGIDLILNGATWTVLAIDVRNGLARLTGW
jgi:uncharacterized membrane protein HdeD (DUF308 family)